MEGRGECSKNLDNRCFHRSYGGDLLHTQIDTVDQSPSEAFKIFFKCQHFRPATMSVPSTFIKAFLPSLVTAAILKKHILQHGT